MKSQDIVILLKKITSEGQTLSDRGIAESLGISASCVSESLVRCRKAQLVDRHKKKVNTLALREFLVHGIAYVFPAEAGRVGRGVATYTSASPIREHLSGGMESFVWHYLKGNNRGQQIEPLYHTVPEAALHDKELYELLVVVDVLRMGKAREKEIAVEELDNRISLYAEKQ